MEDQLQNKIHRLEYENRILKDHIKFLEKLLFFGKVVLFVLTAVYSFLYWGVK